MEQAVAVVEVGLVVVGPRGADKEEKHGQRDAEKKFHGLSYFAIMAAQGNTVALREGPCFSPRVPEIIVATVYDRRSIIEGFDPQSVGGHGPPLQ